MKKKNVIGAFIMAGMILFAMPWGVHNSLTSLREDAQSAYYYDKTGFAIYQGVEAREEAATNMITVANRYTADYPQLQKPTNDLEYAVKLSESTYGDFGAEAEANRQMGEAAQKLFEELDKVKLSEKDAKYPRQLIAQMEAEQDKIQRSSYNEDAEEFNARLEKFPVNLLRGIAFVEPLELFA